MPVNAIDITEANPAWVRDQLRRALVERGYWVLSLNELENRRRPLGLIELTPGPDCRPITPTPHSLLLYDDGKLQILPEGAAFAYAVALPERSIRLLLRGVL